MAESEMVERVARALCGDGADRLVCPIQNIVFPFKGYQFAPDESSIVPMWQLLTTYARAAIAAMSEPTDEMVRAGVDEYEEEQGGMYRERKGIVIRDNIWAAMIAAALHPNTSPAQGSE